MRRECVLLVFPSLRLYIAIVPHGVDRRTLIPDLDGETSCLVAQLGRGSVACLPACRFY